MKQIIKTILVVLLAAVVVNTASAKNDNDKKNMEEVASSQAKVIAGDLKLDETTTTKFVDTYVACQKEIWSECPPPKPDAKITTDAEAETAILQQFEHGQKMLDIRRKYYEEYKKFLTPLQIERMYRLERKMMGRLAKKHYLNDKRQEARDKRKKARDKRKKLATSVVNRAKSKIIGTISLLEQKTHSNRRRRYAFLSI